MDNRLREAFRNLKKSQDKQQLIKIYQEIRCLMKQNLFGASKQFKRDLIVLCAEEAQKFNLNDVANDCLDMFFKSAPPEDMWTCRGILCKVVLLSQNVHKLDDLHGISSWTIKSLGIITKKSRLHTYGLEMCSLYLSASQSLMRKRSYKHLLRTLKHFLEFFDALDPPNLEWQAIIHVHHINSLLDDKSRRKEADDFIVKSFSLIMDNALDYKLHIMKLVVNRKLDKLLRDVLQSQTHLQILYQICQYRSAINKTELPFSLDDLFKNITDPGFSTNVNMCYLLIDLCMLCLEEMNLELVQSCLSSLRNSGPCFMDENIRAKIEFLDIDCQFQDLELKGRVLCKPSLEQRLHLLNNCANLLKCCSSTSVVQLGCIIAWNACKPLLQSNHRSKVKQYMTLIYDLLCNCKSHMHDVMCQITFELAKCYHDEDEITQALYYLDKALENDEGKYKELLTMFQHRLKLSQELDRDKFERVEDQAAQLLEHSRPMSSCPPPLDRTISIKIGTILAPFIFMEAFDAHFTWNDLCDVNDIESAMVEISCKLQRYQIWQENSVEYFKDFKDKSTDLERMMIWADLAKMSKSRSLWKICMIASAFCLVYDDGRWSLSLDSSSTTQLANVNNSSMTSAKKRHLKRVSSWHNRDNKSLQSSISRSEAPDKDSPSVTSPTPTIQPMEQILEPLEEIAKPSQEKIRKVFFDVETTEGDDDDEEEEGSILLHKEVLRTLGEVRLLHGDATFHLLKADGVRLGSEEFARIPNLNCSPSCYNLLPEWIAYIEYLKNVGKSAVQDFLRAGELGLELKEGWLVESASAYLWNHHQEAVRRGCHDVIISNFLSMYDVIERFDGFLLPQLLVRLAAQIADAIISKHLERKSVEKSPDDDDDDPKDSSTLESISKKTSKKHGSKNVDKKKKLNKIVAKDNIDPELKHALDICEYVMTRINSAPSPSSQLDVSSRKPLLQAWLKCKHLLGQSVGNVLFDDQSVLLYPDNLHEKCRHKIKAVVIVECLRFSSTSNFKDSPVPSNSEILELLKSCEWIPEKKIIVVTIDKEELVRDLLSALELFTTFASRAIEGLKEEDEVEVVEVVEAALTEAFKCSNLLMEGSFIGDEEACTKFNVLMSHAHLTRGRHLVIVASTKTNIRRSKDGDDDDGNGDDDDDDDSYDHQIKALRHFVCSAKFAWEVKDIDLVWSSTRRFCNVCLGLSTSACRRMKLKGCIQEMLAIVQGSHGVAISNINNNVNNINSNANNNNMNHNANNNYNANNNNYNANNNNMNYNANNNNINNNANNSNMNYNAKRSKSPKPTKELAKKGRKEAEKVVEKSPIEEKPLSSDDDDAVYLINNLLYKIYVSDNDLESALKLLEHAYKNVHKPENKKNVLRDLLFVRIVSGRDIISTIAKFQDEGDVYVHDLWINIARKAPNPTLQVLAYHAAIETLQTEKNDWLKFESLLEFAQFLYCKGHEVQEVQDLVEWSTQVLSSISSREVNTTEFRRSREAKFKDKSEARSESKKSSKESKSKSPARKKSPKTGKSPRSKDGKKEKKTKEGMKEGTRDGNTKEEGGGKIDAAELETIERTIGADLSNRMTFVDIQKLENIVHLEGLLRCYVVMAMISEMGSGGQVRFSLICYQLIMRIWKQLMKDRPITSTSLQSIKSDDEDGKKKKKKKEKKEKKDKRSRSSSSKDSDQPMKTNKKFPKSLKDWSTFALPSSTIDSIKAVATETFPKPNLTIWYLLEISKIFQHLMLTPFLFPSLVLIETITKAYLDCKSLINYVHIRLLDASIELNLADGITFHKELSSFQIEVDDLLKSYNEAVDSEADDVTKCGPNTNDNNSLHRGRFKMIDLEDKVDLINIFIDFASICNKFCIYKPVHRLLHHVIEISRSTNNNAALNRSYLELGKVYCDEKNFCAAYDVINKLICSDDDIDLQVWLSAVLVAIETYGRDFRLSEEDRNNKINEILDDSINRIISTSDKFSQYILIMLKVEKCKHGFNSIRSSSSSSPTFNECGVKIVEVMDRLASDLRDMNKLVESAQVLEDGGSYLYEMSQVDSLMVHQVHHFMMKASSFYEKAELQLEEQLSLIYDCLQDVETEGCSLKLERKLSHLKMKHVRLLLAMFEAHVGEKRTDRCILRRQNSIDKLFQELVPDVVECSGTEVEWNQFMGIIVDKIFFKITAVHQLCLNYSDAKSEISFLYGKSFYLLSQQCCYDLPSHWDVYMLNEPECAGPDVTNSHRYDRYVQLFQKLKTEKSSSDRCLVRSTEFLFHALLHSKPRQIELGSEISLLLMECFGQHDPRLSSSFLLYYQSCESTKHLKCLLSTCLQDTTSSEVAVLYNQMMNIHEDAFVNNSLAGPLHADLDKTLRRKLPAWKKLEVSKSHFEYVNDYDKNYFLLSLVHSIDKKHLYGALVRGEQPSEDKTSYPSSVVTKMKTSRDKLSCLKDRWKAYKEDLKENLLRCEMRIYAHHIHQKHVSSDKDENIILEQEFFQVLDLMEEYLKPLVDELRFHIRKQSLSSPSDTSDTPPHTLVILADEQLLELPLEGMAWLRGIGNIGSISRDVSMNLLHRRAHEETEGGGSSRESKDNQDKPDPKLSKSKQKHLKQKSQKKTKIKGAQPEQLGDSFRVHSSKFKYLVDPYNDAVLSVPTAVEIFKKFQSDIGKSVVSQWKGFAADDVPPSKGQIESLITMEGSGIYLTFEKFSNLFDMMKIPTTNLSDCQMMLILDLCQSGMSYNRQLKHMDCKIPSCIENPVDMALLLSMSGVMCLLQNQWYSSPKENFKRFQRILKDLFTMSCTTGEAMMMTVDPKLRLTKETTFKPITASTDLPKRKREKGQKKSKEARKLKSPENVKSRTPTPNYMSVFHKKELILKRSMFNMVCYGLPNVIIATAK